MKKTYRHITVCVVKITVLILFMMMSVPVSDAAEVYTAEARGHYRNPVDGSIEDPGNNAGIGEGMVGNVVHGISLIEKDDDGKLYATVRYRMRENIRDIKIWVKPKQSSSFVQVPVKETKSDGKTGDFRFEIPSTDCIVKSGFFVIPMSREVIFFITLGNLQAGKGDFKAMVSTGSQNPTLKAQGTDDSARKSENRENKVNRVNEKKSEENRSDGSATSKNGASVTENRKNRISQENLGYNHGLLTNKDFKDENKAVSEKQSNVKPESKNTERIIESILVITFSVFLGMFFLGAFAVVILYLFIKKRNNDFERKISSDSGIGKNYKADVTHRSENTDGKCISGKNPSEGDSLWHRHPGFYSGEGKND